MRSYLGKSNSYMKMTRRTILCVHTVFSTMCTFEPVRPFCANSFLLAGVCHTADCNVFMLRRSSCSSTLPIFVPQIKDDPYLNLNLASHCHLYHHMKQPAEIVDAGCATLGKGEQCIPLICSNSNFLSTCQEWTTVLFLKIRH